MENMGSPVWFETASTFVVETIVRSDLLLIKSVTKGVVDQVTPNTAFKNNISRMFRSENENKSKKEKIPFRKEQMSDIHWELNVIYKLSILLFSVGKECVPLRYFLPLELFLLWNRFTRECLYHHYNINSFMSRTNTYISYISSEYAHPDYSFLIPYKNHT